MQKFILVLTFLLLGCRGSNSQSVTPDSKPTAQQDPTHQNVACLPGIACQDNFSDVTNVKVCDLPSAAIPSLFGSWQHVRNYADGRQETSTVTLIHPNQIQVETTCLKKKAEVVEGTLTVFSSTSVSIHGTSHTGLISVLGHDPVSDQVGLVDGSILKCSADLEEGKFRYAFQGKCLALSMMGNGKKFLLVPTTQNPEAL